MVSAPHRRRFVDNLVSLETRRKLNARQLPDWIVGIFVWFVLPALATAVALGVIVLTILLLRAIGWVA